MKVVIDLRGGVLNLQDHIEIENFAFSRTARGVRALSRDLFRNEYDSLIRLAARLLDDDVKIAKSSGFPPSCSMDITITVEVGGMPPKTLQFSSGDGVPGAAWDLVRFVDRFTP